MADLLEKQARQREKGFEGLGQHMQSHILYHLYERAAMPSTYIYSPLAIIPL